MKNIRYEGLAAPGGHFDKVLHERFGYRAIREGNDWVIPASDPALRRGPKEVLKLHPEICLTGSSLEATANRLASAVPNDFDSYDGKKPDKIGYAADCGLLSDINKLVLQLTFVGRPGLVKLLVSEVLPFMIERMRATHVAAISIDANNQQASISLMRIAYLIQRYGLQKADNVRKKNILYSMTPDPLSLLGYLDCFTVFAPGAITLPTYRLGCAFHFYRQGGWEFPHAATVGVLEQFQSQQTPRSKHPDLFVLDDLDGFEADDVWSYLRFLVKGMNTLASYLADPRNFLFGETVDLLRQLQTHSAIALLFADLARITAVSDSHSRVTFAFGALDKIANLRRKHSGTKQNEGEVMRALVSLAQAREIRRVIGERTGSLWPKVAQKLREASGAFTACHRHLKMELGSRGLREKMRLLRVGAHRNLSHGAFLTGDQFDQLFLESAGDIPYNLPALPFLLTIGLMLDPIGFLGFEPKVA